MYIDNGAAPPRKVVLVQPKTPGPNHWRSMTKYAAGLAEMLAPTSQVEVVSASNYNMPWPFRRLFHRYRDLKPMPRRWREPVDLVHFTDVFVAPHAGRFSCARVSTIHDMIPMAEAQFRHVPSIRWRLAFLRSLKSLSISDIVVVPSENTKREFLEAVSYPADRVRVVPVLVPDVIAPPRAGSTRQERVILSVGTTAPYKNVPVLIHALANPSLSDTKVIRVGTPLEPEYRALAEQLGVWHRIEERIGLSELELVNLYQTSTLLVQPSLTEGFGMPVAEAMAAGCPVLASDGGSLPEVCGGAARIVKFRQHHPARVSNLDDARDFGEAIAELLADGPERARLSEAGLVRAESFRSSAVLPLLLDAYAAATRLSKVRNGA